MKRRTYTGDADLKLLQEFNAAAIAATNHCGYLHPGDIPHHIYDGNREYDPAEIMTIWEDEQGVAAAGMEFATVAHFGNNEAARGLYQACGFKPWHMQDGYVKHFSS